MGLIPVEGHGISSIVAPHNRSITTRLMPYHSLAHQLGNRSSCTVQTNERCLPCSHGGSMHVCLWRVTVYASRPEHQRTGRAVWQAEVLLDVRVGSSNNIRAALATLRASFSGFPLGSSLTSAHINAGAIGRPGPIVIDLHLTRGQVMFPDGTASFTTTVAVAPPVAQKIIADASSFYFEADTALNPGIIQGQLTKVIVTYNSDEAIRKKRHGLPTLAGPSTDLSKRSGVFGLNRQTTTASGP